MSEPRIEDIPHTDIDLPLENDRFERWYCWSRGIDLDWFRRQVVKREADSLRNYEVHHLRCMWLNAKRDAKNQAGTT